MTKCLSLVAVVAFSLVTGIARAQQCGAPDDPACTGACPDGTVCGVSAAGTGCDCAAAQPLGVKKLSIKLNFAKPDVDGIVLQGTVPVPAGFHAEGKLIVIDVGGVIKSFTLDAKGKAVADLDRAQLKTKFEDGEIPSQDAKFSAKFTKGNFAPMLVDERLTNRTVKDDPVTVKVDVTIDGVAYTQTKPQLYKAKQGKTGATK